MNVLLNKFAVPTAIVGVLVGATLLPWHAFAGGAPTLKAAEGTRQPFAESISSKMPAGKPQEIKTFQAPSGKSAYLEYISGRIAVPAGQKFYASLDIKSPNLAGNVQTVWPLYLRTVSAEMNYDNAPMVTFSQPIGLHIGAGTTLKLTLTRNGLSGDAAIYAHVAGYAE